jgi:hypothetical protein
MERCTAERIPLGEVFSVELLNDDAAKKWIAEHREFPSRHNAA